MSQETQEDSPVRPILSAEENAQVWERQNFLLGCIEMARITDDIIAPVFQKLTGTFLKVYADADLILMDCESPLDDLLYNVGIRLSFEHEENLIVISMMADPSEFTFTLMIEGLTEEPIDHHFKYHEITPRYLNRVLIPLVKEHFPKVEYAPVLEKTDQIFETYKAPFRVSYDDNGNVSDVATTKTLREAANMGSTFAKMFRNEKAITILDADGNEIC